jgi:uncharacterized oxidoreductase
MGVPVDAHDPVILDFGTSVVAEGKVRSHNVAGTTVPLGWVLDPDGLPTTDPGVLYRTPPGSILPMGGEQAYKGFGLAFLLDLLSGGLSGGKCSYPDAGPARGNNVLFILLDPSRFSGADALGAQASRLCDFVRATPRRAGVETILLPGDPERAAFERRSRDGIPLPQGHWDLLVAIARKLGVEPPAVPDEIAPNPPA